MPAAILAGAALSSMPMTTITWREIDAHWPGAGPAWDQVAPTIDWAPTFRYIGLGGVLVAVCMADHPRRRQHGPCRCRLWDGERWRTREEHYRLARPDEPRCCPQALFRRR